jgi:hypothetical protein
MDFALSSSMVLGAAVLLWLLWVAPYFLKRRRSLQPAADAALLSEAADADGQGPRPAGMPAPPSASPPETGPSRPASAPETEAAPRAATPSPPTAPTFRIRWGRVAFAGIGLLALLAAVVSLVLVVVGVPPWLPLVFAAGTAASATVLRSLAVRDRRRRVEAAFRAAMRAPEDVRDLPVRRTGPSEVFDAGHDPAPAPRVLTREELRAVALEVARASQASAEAAAKASGADDGGTWEPVDVPRPSYMESAKAERPEPEPLPVPEELRPEGRPTLRPQPEAPEPGSVPGVPMIGPRPAPGRTGALGNLDDVLRRRRA